MIKNEQGSISMGMCKETNYTGKFITIAYQSLGKEIDYIINGIGKVVDPHGNMYKFKSQSVYRVQRPF